MNARSSLCLKVFDKCLASSDGVETAYRANDLVNFARSWKLSGDLIHAPVIVDFSGAPRVNGAFLLAFFRTLRLNGYDSEPYLERRITIVPGPQDERGLLFIQCRSMQLCPDRLAPRDRADIYQRLVATTK